MRGSLMIHMTYRGLKTFSLSSRIGSCHRTTTIMVFFIPKDPNKMHRAVQQLARSTWALHKLSNNSTLNLLKYTSLIITRHLLSKLRCLSLISLRVYTHSTASFKIQGSKGAFTTTLQQVPTRSTWTRPIGLFPRGNASASVRTIYSVIRIQSLMK
jgi:hypothetical protein